MKKNYESILITGASSGIGRELAIQYSKRNIFIFLIGRNKTRLLETANICKNNGANVFFKSIDVKNKTSLKNQLLEWDKIKNIDLIIANAGISSKTSINSKLDQTYDIFETNIFGVLNTIEPLIPNFIQRKKGQIALMSSMSSFIGMPSCPAYSSSKSCISTYGEGLRGVLKEYNIGVSIICPSFIKTPLTDKNNFSMPFIMSVEKASKKIIKKISKNQGLIAFPYFIYLLMKIFRFLPFSFTNYIFSKLPKK